MAAMHVDLDLVGLTNVRKRLDRVSHMLDDAAIHPLLDSLGDMILEQNRAGVLAGKDKDDLDAPPLRYRRNNTLEKLDRSIPKTDFGGPHKMEFDLFYDEKPTSMILQKGTKGKNRGKTARFSMRSIRSGKFGTVMEPHPLGKTVNSMLPNNNLTTDVYRTLTGPRLAPRFEGSRSIANLRKLDPQRDGGDWLVQAVWMDALRPDGGSLLTPHFEGRGVPLYDLRGIRPKSRRVMKDLIRAWAMWIIRGAAGSPPRNSL
jgi:hypothetical protein